MPDRHTYRTRQNTKYKLQLRKPRKITTNQNIITSGPRIWNELPNTCYLKNENMLQMKSLTKLYEKEILSGYNH